ncbi:MAG: type II toxin-antitoxin system RelE/ParE family toxin [Thiobacillaceae bacterium]
MKLRIRAVAEVQILRAARWYEHRARGLWAEFMRAIATALASIQRQPRAYVEVFGDVRRARMRRFPYAIFYIEDEKAIQVLRCLHQHQNPQSWPH